MTEHLPALVVVLPFIGGMLTVFMGRRTLPWLWATATMGACLYATVQLLFQVLAADEPIRYAMGDWEAPWGIEYVVDTLNASILLVVAAVGFVVTIYARRSVEREIPDDRRHFFYSLWLLCITGLLGMTITGDAFNVYVLLEISSLATYALVAMGHRRDRRALTAALNYLLLGSIGASFILIGIGYLYMMTGTLNMADMTVQLRELRGSGTVHAAFAFLVVGLSIKMALFPLHTWMPNAYTYAPTAVTALLSATATKVGIYLAVRFFYFVFGSEMSFQRVPNGAILMACGCLAIVLGSLSAIRQNQIKRLLAFSSVAQIGYIVVGFSMANLAGRTGALVHIMNHALMKGGLFMAVGAMIYKGHGTTLAGWRGIGKRMPITMAAFVVGGLGLVGVPLTAGFISKWYLVLGAIEANLWPIVFIILAGSLLALYYVWRVVEVAYFEEPHPDAPKGEAPWSMIACTWAMIGGSLYLGVSSNFTIELAERAAKILGGSQ